MHRCLRPITVPLLRGVSNIPHSVTGVVKIMAVIVKWADFYSYFMRILYILLNYELCGLDILMCLMCCDKFFKTFFFVFFWLM